MTVMRRYTFFLIYAAVVFASPSQLAAQSAMPYYRLERMSYDFYVHQEWDSLIGMQRKYRSLNIHSYALDFRYGAAYFHRKNYRKALRFFENADLKQSRDLLLLEYRYYAYLQSGRYEDAQKLCLEFDRLGGETDFCRDKTVGSLGVESKIYLMHQNFKEDEGITATQKALKRREYYAFYLQLSSLKNWQFTLAPMWLYEQNDYRNTSWEVPDWKETVLQNHLYMSAKYAIGYGKRIWVNDHYVLTHTEARPNDSIHSYYTYETDEKHVAGLFYQQSFRNFDVLAGAQYAPQDSLNTIIPAVGFTWYPWGNDRFFTYTHLSYQSPATVDNDTWLIKQKAGIKIGQKLWLEPFGMYGKSTHYYDDQGYIIYAQQEPMNYYWGIDIQYLLGEKYLFYASFQQYHLTKTQTRDMNISSLLFGIKRQIK